MFECPHCGNQLPDGAAFCNQCWRPVDDPPAQARSSEAAAVGELPAHDDRPSFTPAPGGPSPPESDDVTTAYPTVPPPQPPSPWVSGGSTSGWGAAAPPQPSPPPPSPWGQPPAPGGHDPYAYGTPPPGAYGAPPPGAYGAPQPGAYGPPPGYPPAPGPYGYPPGYGYPPVQSGPGTNGMAITALIVSLVGLFTLCGVISPVAIPFGHIGLSQIKRTGESGRGMAIAGLVVGYIALAGWVIFVIALIASAGSSA